MRTPRSGFSLLEVMVVLTIIGLLTGGIIAGSKLIQTSKLRSVISQTMGYSMAMQQFREQYGELPGDFTQAVRIWGRADGNTDLTGNCAAAGTDAGNGRSTCNGNGNGSISGNEQFRAWQQMANAGLIAGNFTGLNGSGGIYHPVPGSNAPAGALKYSVYAIGSGGTLVSDATYFDGNYDNYMLLGQRDTSSWPMNILFTPKEASDIDIKSDDGAPAFGYVTTLRGTFLNNNGRSCVAPNAGDVAGTDPYGTDPGTSKYRRDEKSTLCYLYFMYGYGVNSAVQNH